MGFPAPPCATCRRPGGSLGGLVPQQPPPSNRRLTWVSLRRLSLSDTTAGASRWPLRMSHSQSVAPVLSQGFSTRMSLGDRWGPQCSHSWDPPRADQSRSLLAGPPGRSSRDIGVRVSDELSRRGSEAQGQSVWDLEKPHKATVGLPSPRTGEQMRGSPRSSSTGRGPRQPQSSASGTGRGGGTALSHPKSMLSGQHGCQSLPVTTLEPEKI